MPLKLGVGVPSATSTLPSAHTACIAGDSIAALCQDEATSETQTYYTAYSWVWWAQMYLGQPLEVTANYGHGGDKTSDLIAKLPQIVADPARWVLVSILVNDLFDGTGTTLATMQANLTTIFSTLQAAGKRVAYMLPTGSGYGTATTLTNLATMTRWVKQYARRNPGLVLFDGQGFYTDPSDGMPVAGYVRPGDAGPANNNRGVHPGYVGAAKIGRALAEALEPYMLNANGMRPASNADTLNLLGNGTFSGGTTIATGWDVVAGNTGLTEIGATVAAVKASRVDGRPGQVQQLSYAGGASGGAYLTKTVTSGFAVGDRVVLEALFETDPDTAGQYGMTSSITAFDSGNVRQGGCGGVLAANANDTTDPVQPIAAGVDVLPRIGAVRTVPLTVPAGTTKLRAEFWLPAGTTRWLYAAMRKVDF